MSVAKDCCFSEWVKGGRGMVTVFLFPQSAKAHSVYVCVSLFLAPSWKLKCQGKLACTSWGRVILLPATKPGPSRVEITVQCVCVRLLCSVGLGRVGRTVVGMQL